MVVVNFENKTSFFLGLHNLNLFPKTENPAIYFLYSKHPQLTYFVMKLFLDLGQIVRYTTPNDQLFFIKYAKLHKQY